MSMYRRNRKDRHCNREYVADRMDADRISEYNAVRMLEK